MGSPSVSVELNHSNVGVRLVIPEPLNGRPVVGAVGREFVVPPNVL